MESGSTRVGSWQRRFTHVVRVEDREVPFKFAALLIVVLHLPCVQAAQLKHVMVYARCGLRAMQLRLESCAPEWMSSTNHRVVQFLRSPPFLCRYPAFVGRLGAGRSIFLLLMSGARCRPEARSLSAARTLHAGWPNVLATLGWLHGGGGRHCHIRHMHASPGC